MAENDVRLSLTCDCGHKFEIPIAGKDLEALEITCPGCGEVSTLSPDQVGAIVEAHGRSRHMAIEQARKAVSDTLARVTRGSKHFRYRPKR